MYQYDTASKLYNELLEIYFDEYYGFSGAKRKKINSKYDPDNVVLNTFYREWFKEKDVKSADVPPLPSKENMIKKK